MNMHLTSPGPGPARKTPMGWSSTRRLLWVSEERDGEGAPLRTRSPSESYTVFPLEAGFTAAGRSYTRLGLLLDARVGESSVFRDCYGREVLLVLERFPCFDAFDSLYENRFEQWFLICVDGVLTQVKYTDETDFIEVWEDAAALEDKVWEELLDLGWHSAAE